MRLRPGGGFMEGITNIKRIERSLMIKELRTAYWDMFNALPEIAILKEAQEGVTI